MSTQPPDQPATARLSIDGMHCPACAARVTKALASLPGVQQAQVSLEDRQATVIYQPAAVTPAALQQAVTEAGYTVTGVEL